MEASAGMHPPSWRLESSGQGPQELGTHRLLATAQDCRPENTAEVLQAFCSTTPGARHPPGLSKPKTSSRWSSLVQREDRLEEAHKRRRTSTKNWSLAATSTTERWGVCVCVKGLPWVRWYCRIERRRAIKNVTGEVEKNLEMALDQKRGVVYVTWTQAGSDQLWLGHLEEGVCCWKTRNTTTMSDYITVDVFRSIQEMYIAHS